jgi:hypothetical protein
MAPTLGFERSTLNMVAQTFPISPSLEQIGTLPEDSGQPFRHLPAAE